MPGSPKQGLEITGIVAVDVQNKTALHLEAIQTPAHCDLEKESMTLLDWYEKLITDRKYNLSKISTYVAADAYFSKESFVSKIIEAGFHIVSRQTV